MHPFDEPKTYETREIREIVDSGIASGEISGWQKFRNARKFAKYGRQYGWERIPPACTADVWQLHRRGRRTALLTCCLSSECRGICRGSPSCGKVFRGLTCRTYPNQQNKLFNKEETQKRFASGVSACRIWPCVSISEVNLCSIAFQRKKIKRSPMHKVPKMTLTMAELADELHISLPTARKLVRKSGFPAFSVGSRILINREGLQRWLDVQPPIAVT